MGTSTSQPSPIGRTEVGRKWHNVKQCLKIGAPAREVVLAINNAFTAEYGENSPLLDKGVKLIISLIKSIENKQVEKIPTFIAEGRRILALEGCNSFFAELALTCAAKSLLKNDTDIHQQFTKEYCKKAIDYIISRDLAFTIGSKGLTNLYSVEVTSKSISNYIDSMANTNKHLNFEPEALINKIFNSLKGSPL
ncbi:hypothetical protein [Candidatus Berkiella aquae]|uniref:Uncharacterized protein n=1 Tax=Candidatus Berkiella aquae TaxID=295108 RepID=A0A0Q9YMB1_9GAMM|nr:hypothetical protein [Candidatus Berkiella aquae]MCS5710431.1 hypothetical protein [Candidatus Berkiella aquae]